MKDKIAELVRMKTNQLGSYSTMDIVNEVLDLIAKELPKEKDCNEHPGNSNAYFCVIKSHEECVRCKTNLSYNQCLKDIKHKLEVE